MESEISATVCAGMEMEEGREDREHEDHYSCSLANEA